MTIEEYRLALCLLEKDGKPLLEGVREKCQGSHIKVMEGVDYFYCDDCDGRGWIPSTDPWKWLGALGKRFDEGHIPGDVLVDILSEALDGPLAFYSSLAKALRVKEE